MPKIAPVEVTRRARAAGLSLSDAAALSRLHESEEDLTAMIEAYKTDASDDGGYDSATFLKAVDRR